MNPKELPTPAKTPGPENVDFFIGLNKLPEDMKVGLAIFEGSVKSLMAQAYTRGFAAGKAAR